MEIAIDVDGVLAEQVKPVLSRVSDEYGVIMEKSDIQSWDEPIPETNSNIKIEIESAHEDPDYVLQMPIIGNARKKLAEISENHTIKIVTSRTKMSDETTKEWLCENDLKFDKYVNTAGKSKSSVNADILIDDFHKNVKEFANSGKVGILFTQPWNEGYASSMKKHENIHIANNWDEAVDIMNDIQKRIGR